MSNAVDITAAQRPEAGSTISTRPPAKETASRSTPGRQTSSTGFGSRAVTAFRRPAPVPGSVT
ncbi:hypothetical protein [Streptomyces sp. NPDC001450]